MHAMQTVLSSEGVVHQSTDRCVKIIYVLPDFLILLIGVDVVLLKVAPTVKDISDNFL